MSDGWHMAGLGSRALQLYLLLMERHPQWARAGEAAVEGAVLAHKLDQVEPSFA